MADNRYRTYGKCEEMEDMTISLKKFQPQIRKDYKDKFHFWQARMEGYTHAGDLEQADRRGAVMNMAHQFEKQY